MRFPHSNSPFCIEPDGTVRTDGPRPLALLPGSFNPLHHGHVKLAAIAAARLGVPIHFELSVVNADKPELTLPEVERRIAQFVGVAPVWVTRAATFEQKADFFLQAVFVLGWDTAIRVIDPRFYGNDPSRRDDALRKLLACGCRFVVGGRVDSGGTFHCWDGGGLAPEFDGLFVSLTESDFRVDLSSTQLRMRPI